MGIEVGMAAGETGGLFADAAHQGHNIAGIGVHDDHGGFQRLAGAAEGGGEVAAVFVIVIHDVLNVHINAGIDIVAAVIEKMLGGIRRAALGLGQVLNNVADDGVHIIGIDGGIPVVIQTVAENKRLGHGRNVFIMGDIALIIHLPEDGLLAGFVVFLKLIGVIERGVIGDADEAGAFGEAELGDLLAEIGLGSGAHAVTALAKVDVVEVPGHDFVFGVGLFKLQGAKNFDELSLDGDIVLRGEVFDELLGDGGAAKAVLHAQEHIEESAGGSVPVHALMGIKALVLDGHGGLLEIEGKILLLHPYAVGVLIEGGKLPPFAIVLIPDGAGERQRRLLQRDVQVGDEAGFYIDGEDAGEENGGGQKNQQNCGHGLHAQPQGAPNAGRRGIRHGFGGAPRLANLAGLAPGIVFLNEFLKFVHEAFSSDVVRAG